MTRAEEAAKEIYKDGIELFGRRDKSGNLVIRLETMVGILRHAAARGYLQAEKDLALTWEDIAMIDAIILDTNNEFAIDSSKKIIGQNFYEEIARRFNEQKNSL